MTSARHPRRDASGPSGRLLALLDTSPGEPMTTATAEIPRTAAVYRPLAKPAKAAAWSVGVLGVAALGLSVLYFARAAHFGGMSPESWDGTDPYTGNRVPASAWGVPMLGMFLAAVPFIIWFHRARANVDVLTPGPDRGLTKGWAIGGWFIPGAFGLVAALVAHRTWKGSVSAATAHDGRPAARHLLLWGWWLPFAGSMVLTGRGIGGNSSVDRVEDGKTTPAEFLDKAHRASLFFGFGFLLSFIAAAFAVAMVHRITSLQQRHPAAQG